MCEYCVNDFQHFHYEQNITSQAVSTHFRDCPKIFGQRLDDTVSRHKGPDWNQLGSDYLCTSSYVLNIHQFRGNNHMHILLVSGTLRGHANSDFTKLQTSKIKKP